MRFSVALGLFLLTAGSMSLLLHPVYKTGERVQAQGIEAEGPVDVYREIPEWLGVTAVASGGALLLFSAGIWPRARRDRSGRGRHAPRSRP